MEGYQPVQSFGPDVAPSYKELKRGDELAAVSFLSQLANGGPALELAIGTGRIALPLASKGIRVAGIDFSPAMLEQLRLQPGGNEILVTEGDIVDVPVEGQYQLIYILWNSFFNILTQDGQIQCVKNVAKHLTATGYFVMEAYVPSFLYTLKDEQYVNAEAILLDEVKLDVLRHDCAAQTIEESHISITPAGIHLNPVVQRYAWPSEIDLMAKIAGLHLKNRWRNWEKMPFSATSGLHISVYGF
jgi:SAM-dependent methyltransferase